MSHLHANMWRSNRDPGEREWRVKSPSVVNRYPVGKRGGSVTAWVNANEARNGSKADGMLRKFSWETE